MVNDSAFSLPDPERMTRPTLTKMRQRLGALRSTLVSERKELEAQTRRGFHKRAGTVVRNLGGSTVMPAYSTSKTRKNPDKVIFARMREIAEVIEQIDTALLEIRLRLPNLASEPEQPKRKPVVPPSVDEF